MFRKLCHVDFPLCQKLEMIVWFVKYWRSLQTERLIAFLFWLPRFPHALSLRRFSAFLNATLSKGTTFSPLALRRLPMAVTGFSPKENCPVTRTPWARSRWALIPLSRFFSSSFTSLRNTRPYPPLGWTYKACFLLKSGIAFLCSLPEYNTTSLLFSGLLNLSRTFFFHSGSKEGLVICKYSLNYSSVFKQHILEFFNERQTREQQVHSFVAPVRGFPGPHSPRGEEPHPVVSAWSTVPATISSQ